MTDYSSPDDAVNRMVGDAAALGAMRDDWERGDRDALEEMVVASWIIRAQQHLVLRIETLLQPLGLTMTKFECLVVLLASKNGALGMNKMAERLGVHPTSITYAVDALIKVGLAERRAHPRDRRRKLAALSPRGREVGEQALRILEADRFGVRPLGEVELRRLALLLQAAITPPQLGAGASEADPSVQQVLRPLAHRTRNPMIMPPVPRL
jgi:DNA-binding MarR family transcriptional regulator